MNTLRVAARKAGLLTVKHLDVRLRKIRSLKTNVLSGKPRKSAPVMARGLEAKLRGRLSDRRT